MLDATEGEGLAHNTSRYDFFSLFLSKKQGPFGFLVLGSAISLQNQYQNSCAGNFEESNKSFAA